LTKFSDHFSNQAKTYSSVRPTYPRKLFEFLVSHVQTPHRAWDAATGNGQAAIDLANYFDEVLASDASQKQIDHAQPHSKIKYSVHPSENTPYPHASFDMVTVAQALHWFKHEAFFGEVKRVLKPGGIFAAWCYERQQTTDAAINAILKTYTYDIVGSFWPAEINFVWEKYKTIAMPFAEISAPEFSIVLKWTLQNFKDYLMSWSATQLFIEKHGKNPLDLIATDLDRAWPHPNHPIEMNWNIFLKVGRHV